VPRPLNAPLGCIVKLFAAATKVILLALLATAPVGAGEWLAPQFGDPDIAPQEEWVRLESSGSHLASARALVDELLNSYRQSDVTCGIDDSSFSELIEWAANSAPRIASGVEVFSNSSGTILYSMRLVAGRREFHFDIVSRSGACMQHHVHEIVT
jgi:hypothetical protein